MDKDEFITNLILLGFKFSKSRFTANDMYILDNIKIVNIRSNSATLLLSAGHIIKHTFERVLEELTNYLIKLQEPDNATITRSNRCNGSIFRLPH